MTIEEKILGENVTANKRSEIMDEALDMLNSFNERADKCEDTLQYCALVASLLTFQEIVLASFKQQFLQDGSPEELDAFMHVMRDQAWQMAQPVVKKWNEENLD